MSIEEKANAYDKAVEKAKKWHNAPNVDKIPTFGNRIIEDIFPELYKSKDEQIKEALIELVKCNERSGYTLLNNVSTSSMIDWIEKQEQSKKISIWKHWKNGICGNGEGKLVFLIKSGATYSLSSCLSFECDYIELSELENLMLEKQGKQKPCGQMEKCAKCQFVFTGYCNGTCILKNKEPKFDIGDWIIFNGLTLYIKEIVQGYYRTISKGGIINSYDWGIDNAARFWTINEAKDGDILRLGNVIAIFKKYIGQEKCICYCSFCEDGNGFEIPIENGKDNVYGCTNTTPATQKERVLLFQKMKEAGYTWDSDKKELVKL
jgi:hypothetical protein